jgi:hypothetical protein
MENRDQLFGKEFKAYEKTWIVLRQINSGLIEAVEKDVPMPAPIMLIQFDWQKEQTEIDPQNYSLTVKKGLNVPGEL